jgi:hypothetical protein
MRITGCRDIMVPKGRESNIGRKHGRNSFMQRSQGRSKEEERKGAIQ